ncbi:MAG: DUF4145 domain-containing protein [Burkholderiales bacterium]|nr:DUF4145 domain-containing protein [Burkholderiales bacterium]
MGEERQIAARCPHCLTSVHTTATEIDLGDVGRDARGDVYRWLITHYACPRCREAVFHLTRIGPYISPRTWMVYPKGVSRPKAPPEVTNTEISEDYDEACLVLADSAKASAGLSRRCLQHVLADAKLSAKRDLNDAIEEALASNRLPTHIAENLDAVRAIGNFAAHPIKSKHSGEVVPVEPGEAEWNLDVLESLFDFLYVEPARSKKKREALDKKLAEAGKPPLKS